MANLTDSFTNITMDFYKSTLMTWVEDPGVEEYQGLNMSTLKMDEAYVITSSDLTGVGIYSVSDDCYKCPFELSHVVNSSEGNFVVNTARRSTWRLMSTATEKYISPKNRSGVICELRPDVGEFGVYRLNITSTDCELNVDREPVDIYLPLLLVILLLLAFGVVYSGVSVLISYFRKKGKLRYGDKELATQQRLRALDTFRGLAIVLMIFVNDGAGGYWWLEHATWNGLTVGDLIFPSFLWIMGVCIPLSVKGAFAKGISRWRIFVHIVRRSILMFILGVMCNTIYGSNELGSIRIFGVLQRLGVSYFFAASLYLFTAKKYYAHPRGACGEAMRDIWAVYWCWIASAVLIAGHTALSIRIFSSECQPGYLGPGGKQNMWSDANCTGGAAGFIDRFLLGEKHLYQHSAAIYAPPVTFDPEGLLGCITSIVQVFFGIQAGSTLLNYKSGKSRVARFLAWSFVFALIGAILCGFSREKGIIPINKNLWSISFVLITTSFSLIILSLCYVLTDAWCIWGGGPFRAPGLNAIALYVGHSLCSHVFPFHFTIPHMRTHFIYLVENLWGTILWVIIAHVMARRKVFITL